MSLLSNLEAYWKLDEASGNAADASGNGNTATNSSVTYSTGLINNGAVLSSGNLSAADSASLSVTGDLSISMWIKMNNLPTQGIRFPLLNKEGSYFISLNRNRTGDGAISYFEFDGNVTSSSASSISGQSTITSGQEIITTGAWHHLVFTYNATTGDCICYIDGSLNRTETNSPVSITDTTNACVLGGNTAVFTNGGYFSFGNMDGMMDEVGIWSRALTAAEVTTLYNAGSGIQYPFIIATTAPFFLNFV